MFRTELLEATAHRALKQALWDSKAVTNMPIGTGPSMRTLSLQHAELQGASGCWPKLPLRILSKTQRFLSVSAVRDGS